MQKPDTPDGLFHAGNAFTGEKGTRITVGWLNALISVGAFYSGASEPPSNDLGGPEDFYYCTTSKKIYGPKTTVWPAGVAINKGDKGDQGDAGADGAGMGYSTLAALTAAAGSYTDGQICFVTNDSNPINIGGYRKEGSGWVQWAYDRVALIEQRVTAEEKKTDPVEKCLLVDNDTILELADHNGEIGFRVSEHAVESKKAKIFDTHVVHIPTLSSQMIICDEDLNAILAIDPQGRLIANFDLVPPAVRKNGVYDYEINHIFGYGQSLSTGSHAIPPISLAQAYDSLMFFRGQRPQDDFPSETADVWYQSLVPLVERSCAYADEGETPSSGTADMIKRLIQGEDGLLFTDHSYQLLLSTPGEGGKNIDQLSKSGPTHEDHYARMVNQISYGLALAAAAGKTYAVQAITWTQGESDYVEGTTRANYLAALQQLYSDINGDAKGLTGQAKDLAMITYQLSGHLHYNRTVPVIALAQLDAALNNANIYLATPTYLFTHVDGEHITNESSRWLGAYYGLCYKRVVIDGENWLPVHPISSIRQGKYILLKFHVPAKPLILDTEMVTDPNGTKGFTAVNADGSSITIDSVSIVERDTVKIACATPVAAGAFVRYGWVGTTIQGGPTTGARGNLRDSQGDTLIFDPTGINKPMHNWCVIFEWEV